MSVTRTLAVLRSAVQIAGGWENSDDVTTGVLDQAINYGLVRGYDVMVQRWADYFTLNVDFAIVAGTDSYVLSTIAPDFYKLRHLDVSADGQRFVRCLPHDLDAAYRWTGVSQTDVRRVRYRQQGRFLKFAPVPGAGTGRMFYIPSPTQLGDVADEVTFDVPAEEMLVIHLAQRDILIRSDLSTSSVDQQIAEDTAGLRTAADNRDAGEPFYLNPSGPRRDIADWDDDGGFF